MISKDEIGAASSNTEVTIIDVARAAGVSVSTVSRILNNKPDVAEGTRQRVQRVIRELGYMPHAQAQRLAAGKTRTIGVLYPLSVPGVHRISQLELDFMLGAAAAAGEKNYFFNLVTIPVTEDSLLGMYRGSQVDGVVIMQVCVNDWRVDLLREHNLPFVMIGQCSDNSNLSFVDLDFEASILALFDHLVSLGHRHIGFVNFSDSLREQGYGPAVRSLVAYERALEKFGLDGIYKEVDMTVDAAFEATSEILCERPAVTAVATISDTMAVGIIRAIESMGRSVPGDVSVVGLAAEKIAEFITPPLTAVDFPAYTMGYQGTRMLLNKLMNGAEEQQILIEPRLIVRESTAPPT